MYKPPPFVTMDLDHHWIENNALFSHRALLVSNIFNLFFNEL